MTYKQGDIVYLLPKDEMRQIINTTGEYLNWKHSDIDYFISQDFFEKPTRIESSSEDRWGVYYTTRETNPWKIRDWMLTVPSCDIASEDEYVSIFS